MSSLIALGLRLGVLVVCVYFFVVLYSFGPSGFFGGVMTEGSRIVADFQRAREQGAASFSEPQLPQE